MKDLNEQLLFRLKEKIDQVETLQKSLDKLFQPVGVHLGVNSDGSVGLLLSNTESNILFGNQKPSTCNAETQTERIMEVPVVEQSQSISGAEAESLILPLLLLSKVVNNIPVTKTQFFSGCIGGAVSYEVCSNALKLPLKYRPLDRVCLKTVSVIKKTCGPKKAQPSVEQLLPITAVSQEYTSTIGVETSTPPVPVSHFPL